MTEDCIKKAKAAYYTDLTLIDDKVVEIRQALEENGLLENTWIIYTRDHGEQLRDHKLFMKFMFYRSSVNVPLIIRLPKEMKGKVFNTDVELIDIPSIIFDFLNIDGPPEHRGKSLMPFITDEKNDENYQHKEVCISQIGNYAMGVPKNGNSS